MTDDREIADLSTHVTTVAAEAARSVAADLREAFRAPMDVDYKVDEHDPVTRHDRRAEQVIREHLLSRIPDSTIVGEEGGTIGSGRVHWYVDPIDGTSNFAGGLAFFCTSIGAVVDGRIIGGAINDPMADHLFTASLDGAFMNGRSLRSTGQVHESRAMLLTSYPNNRIRAADPKATMARLGRMIEGYATVRRVGSAALSLAHVAAGWVDAAFGVSVNPWDVTAARLLVQQAGGRYTAWWPDGMRPDSPGTDEDLIAAPGYVAHVPDLQPRLLSEIADDVAATWPS